MHATTATHIPSHGHPSWAKLVPAAAGLVAIVATASVIGLPWSDGSADESRPAVVTGLADVATDADLATYAEMVRAAIGFPRATTPGDDDTEPAISQDPLGSLIPFGGYSADQAQQGLRDFVAAQVGILRAG